MTTPEKPHLLCLDLKHFVTMVTLLIEIGVGVGLSAFGGVFVHLLNQSVLCQELGTHAVEKKWGSGDF